MPESVDPSASPGPSGVDLAAEKALKKKEKARRQWYTFVARVLAQVVGAAASVGLGLFLLQRGQQPAPAATSATPVRVDSHRAAHERAVAVLPLDNFSADPNQEYFADGMTEALTLQLAQVDGLHVISRTSVMRYKDEPKPIPIVAQELAVDFVVEGSVVRADDRVRITAQLIDAKKDEHVWARSYDGFSKDILDLQSRVAAAIASEVKGVLASTSSGRRAIDPVTYDLYLRGRHAWSLRTPEGFENAVKFFTAATERDRGFALAYAGLADAFTLLPSGTLVSRTASNFTRAREAAEKAIALDPNLAEAHASLGAVHFFGERNFEAAERAFERSLQLNNHYATGHQWYAIALSENGRHAEAREHAEAAVEADPLNGVMHQARGLVSYYARDFDTAQKAERRALELNSQLSLARVVLAKALIMTNRASDALAALEQTADANNLDFRLMKAIAHTRAADQASANRIIRAIEAQTPRPDDILIQWHAAMGRHDTALDLMRARRQVNQGVMAVLQVDPLFEKFRADPRFAVSP